jgi:hypothetical protein
MRWLAMLIVLFSGALETTSAQNKPDQSKTETAVCTFQDGKQMSVRYEPPAEAKKEGLPNGELWPRSGSPMYLFTETALTLGDREIAPGAFSMYVIPGKEQWTLIVNRAVSAGSAYDQQQDLVRQPMQIGQLSELQQHLEVAFAHSAPKQCTIRVYYGKTGAWTDFKEK